MCPGNEPRGRRSRARHKAIYRGRLWRRALCVRAPPSVESGAPRFSAAARCFSRRFFESGLTVLRRFCGLSADPLPPSAAAADMCDVHAVGQRIKVD